MIAKRLKLIDAKDNKSIGEITGVTMLPPVGTYIHIKDECYKVVAYNFNTLTTCLATSFKDNGYEIIVKRSAPYGTKNQLH